MAAISGNAARFYPRLKAKD